MPDKKIKVLYVIPTLDFGGAERIMVDLARLLDRKKFTVKIVCMKRAGELASGLDATAVELVVMERGMTPAAFWKLYKLISASKPDIVHTHLFGADVFGIIAARLAGVKKVVSTEHNINYSEGRKKRKINTNELKTIINLKKNLTTSRDKLFLKQPMSEPPMRR
jgi:glycosyltransferase involved in cell wall biosynthesis